MKTFFFLVFFSFFIMPLQAQYTGNDLLGTWQNQKDPNDPSRLVIESCDSTTGIITGYFSSPSGTDGSDFRLSGVVNSRPLKDNEEPNEKHQALAVTFSVRWDSYGSITSWTGVCFEKEGALHLNTNWLLVRAVTDYEWDHVLAGYDLFVKVGKKE